MHAFLLRFRLGRRRRYRRHMEKGDRQRRILARILALTTFLAGLNYIVWAFWAFNPVHPIMAAVFVTAEIYCFLLFVISSLGVWRLRYKPVEGLEIERHYSVDILIPVCGEPIEVVRRTLENAQAIRWIGKRVYVLDDGASDAVEQLAERLGFTYLSRQRSGIPQKDAKAGNLNFGLAHSSSELILVLDADQVPVPHIIETLAGYFRFPRLAFIQSKQSFRVPEDDPFFNNDRVFYNAVQLGFDGHDSVISCGSGVIYRRAALQEIGGFVSWNLVEDLVTSYELHSRGWKSFYYPHALSVGLAPDHIHSVYRQRGQWALDTMRLFFWDNPLLKKGLHWRQRLSYLLIGLSYLCSGFILPFFFVVPIWTYLTGGNVLHRSELEFAIVRGVYFLSMTIAMHYLFRSQQAGRQFQMLAGLFPVYVWAAIRALAYPPAKKPAYRPNNRASRKSRRPTITVILPQLIVLAANGILPFYAAIGKGVPAKLIAGNIAISALVIWSLLPVVLATFSKQTKPSEEELERGAHERAA